MSNTTVPISEWCKEIRVAIEAEMQGFIYGFKVFEILLNRELATA